MAVRLFRLLVVGVALLMMASAARAQQGKPAIQLFPGSTTVMLRGNRVSCGITSVGHLCTAAFVSGEGGFWPRGTSDNYIFNGGLQVAARIMGAPSVGFPWPGDTVGAFFFDPRGDQNVGKPLTRVLDWLAPLDRLAWPPAARALDTSLFAARLLGQPAISDQDTWVRYSDLGGSFSPGRKHPAGLLVEQRTLAFDRPGLTDVVFFVFRLVNISARDPARYQGLAAAGYGPSDIAEIAALGADFQNEMNARFAVQIPDTGYALDSLFMAFAQDADIGDASRNYSSFNLVFGAAVAYKSDFNEPTWQFPLDVFQPPFAQAPGLLGEALLRSPAVNQSGPIAFASNLTGGGPFPDAVGVSMLWRRLSGTILPPDFCQVASPKTRHFCFVAPVPNDTRYYLSSGPVRLDPGQSTVLIVAQVHAPALQSVVAPYIGGDLKPGLPVEGARLVSGLDTVGILDRAAGWVSHSDVNGDGVIGPGEVVTTPYSLYWKIQLAQAVVNAKFLVPEPPDPPSFFLMPGDGRVTVVWQKSATETTGDPFFAVASNPISPLYDPNYRRFDVEGYRIWRGTSPSNMTAIAQLDYAGTSASDYTGQFVGSDGGPNYGQQCAPELSVTTSCPTFPATIGMHGNVIQVPPGGRILLTSGAVAVLRADTAVTGGASGRGRLADTGVPFVFIDSTARNGQAYLYAVTAFDVNSIRSGPSTLESPLVPRAVTPRVQGAQVIPGAATFTLTGRNNTVLDPNGPVPTIDATTGIFSGPEPPTNGLSLDFTAFLSLAASGTVSVHVDSVVPSYDCSTFGGICANGAYFLTVVGPNGTSSRQLSFVTEGARGPSVPVVYALPPIRFLDSLVGRFGGDSTFGLYANATITYPGAWSLQSQGRGAANNFPCCSFPGGQYNGPRWWAGGTNETLTNPNGNNCGSVTSTCVDTAGNASASAAGLTTNTAGILPGLSALFPISGYLTTPNPTRQLEILTSSVTRAADFKIFWGSTAGKVDSVIDVTHRVAVPFSPRIRASWGILNDSSFSNTPAGSTDDGSNAFLTWSDAFCVDPAPAILGLCGGVPQATSAFLMDHAILNPMSAKASSVPGSAALVAQGATGSGFIFYLNGKFFVMQASVDLATCCRNVVWNARFYSGAVLGAPGSFAFVPAMRPPAVPGLTVSVSYTATAFNNAVSNDSMFGRIHTVPDPYYLTNSLETAGGSRILRFVNLPSQAIIRIYSSSGILINILSHNDPTGGGEQAWNLYARGGRIVASGVYFYIVEAPDGRRKLGRFTVVSSGQ